MFAVLKPAILGALVGSLTWGTTLWFAGHGTIGAFFGALGGLAGGTLAGSARARRRTALTGAALTAAAVSLGIAWELVHTSVCGNASGIDWHLGEARHIAPFAPLAFAMNAAGLWVAFRGFSDDRGPPAGRSRASGRGLLIGALAAAWCAYILIFLWTPRLSPGAVILILGTAGGVLGASLGLLLARLSRFRLPVTLAAFVGTSTLLWGAHPLVLGSPISLLVAFHWVGGLPLLVGAILLEHWTRSDAPTITG